MIREITTEIQIGQIEPTYMDITFRLAIDCDGVVPIGAEIHTENGAGPVKVREGLHNPSMWWDFLSVKDQNELVREVTEDMKNPADEWDFNNNGDPRQWRKWRVA
mgnify:CR=1 FL=1